MLHQQGEHGHTYREFETIYIETWYKTNVRVDKTRDVCKTLTSHPF